MIDEVGYCNTSISCIKTFRFLLAGILAVIFLLLSTNCNKRPKHQQELVEAQFTIDTSLLEPFNYKDSVMNLEIKTPKNWIILDSEYIKKLESGILVGDYKSAQLKTSLINKSDSSMLFILDVSGMEDRIYSELKKNYPAILNPDQRWSKVQLSEFKVNCFRIEQYLLQSEQMIHFKLVGYEKRDVESKAHFEIWYFINPTSFEKDIKFVESSIGSLNCLFFNK